MLGVSARPGQSNKQFNTKISMSDVIYFVFLQTLTQLKKKHTVHQFKL